MRRSHCCTELNHLWLISLREAGRTQSRGELRGRRRGRRWRSPADPGLVLRCSGIDSWVVGLSAAIPEAQDSGLDPNRPVFAHRRASGVALNIRHGYSTNTHTQSGWTCRSVTHCHSLSWRRPHLSRWKVKLWPNKDDLTLSGAFSIQIWKLASIRWHQTLCMNDVYPCWGADNRWLSPKQLQHLLTSSSSHRRKMQPLETWSQPTI